jgi:hypothetical protein
VKKYTEWKSTSEVHSTCKSLLIIFAFHFVPSRSEKNQYALKLIEGTGISMSACREIAVCHSTSVKKISVST